MAPAKKRRAWNFSVDVWEGNTLSEPAFKRRRKAIHSRIRDVVGMRRKEIDQHIQDEARVLGDLQVVAAWQQLRFIPPISERERLERQSAVDAILSKWLEHRRLLLQRWTEADRLRRNITSTTNFLLQLPEDSYAGIVLGPQHSSSTEAASSANLEEDETNVSQESNQGTFPEARDWQQPFEGLMRRQVSHLGSPLSGPTAASRDFDSPTLDMWNNPNQQRLRWIELTERDVFLKREYSQMLLGLMSERVLRDKRDLLK